MRLQDCHLRVLSVLAGSMVEEPGRLEIVRGPRGGKRGYRAVGERTSAEATHQVVAYLCRHRLVRGSVTTDAGVTAYQLWLATLRAPAEPAPPTEPEIAPPAHPDLFSQGAPH